jgi:predicted translin family RNA/ssDNA-binding protein
MVLGWFKKKDEQLQLQREFHRNCLEQLDDLEQRINDEEMATLRNAHPDVWVDDEATRELPEKVRLARRFATELGMTLSTASPALDSVWSALESLQGIIDHCEHAVQDLIAGLVMRQSLATIRKSNDA